MNYQAGQLSALFLRASQPASTMPSVATAPTSDGSYQTSVTGDYDTAASSLQDDASLADTEPFEIYPPRAYAPWSPPQSGISDWVAVYTPPLDKHDAQTLTSISLQDGVSLPDTEPFETHPPCGCDPWPPSQSEISDWVVVEHDCQTSAAASSLHDVASLPDTESFETCPPRVRDPSTPPQARLLDWVAAYTPPLDKHDALNPIGDAAFADTGHESGEESTWKTLGVREELWEAVHMEVEIAADWTLEEYRVCQVRGSDVAKLKQHVFIELDDGVKAFLQLLRQGSP